ncbi:Beta-1,3-N-acetylglucosaminyltransferase lunatic fringe, partial [Geodia barretti]
MTKAAWTRAPALFCLFMVVGIAEYFVVIRLHGYLGIEAAPESTAARSFAAVSGGEQGKETPEQVGGGRTGVKRETDVRDKEKVDDDRVLRDFLDDNCKRCTFKERMGRLYDIYSAHGMYSLKDTKEHYHGEPENEHDFVSVVSEPPVEPEVLVEKMNVSEKTKTPPGKAGLNILLSLRTTVTNHRKRLPLLFDTWLTKVNTSQVFLVTDGEDPVLRLVTRIKGMHYFNAKCGNSYLREELCCKAGMEFALMFQERNKAFDWLCHVDDDIYVNMSNLVPLLSRFDPKTEPIYIGRLGCVYDSIVIVCTSTSGSFLSFPNRFVSGKKDDGVQYNFDHLWALWVYLRMLAADFCSICSQGLASVADITVSWQNK